MGFLVEVLTMLSKTNKTMGMNDMKGLNEYAEQRSIKDPTFKKELDQQRINFSAAALVRDLRKSTGLSQREFAKRVGKPQSTIFKIESANMNVSTGLLSEIGAVLNKKLVMEYV